MKSRRKKRSAEMIKAREERRDIPFLGEWKRSWGRPPFIRVLAAWLFAGLPLMVVLGISIGLFALGHLISAIIAFFVALALISQFAKCLSYLNSFSTTDREQVEMDRQFKMVETELVSDLIVKDGQQVGLRIDELAKSYEFASPLKREGEQFQQFLKSLHVASPDAAPRVIEVHSLQQGERRCLFSVVEFDIEMRVGKSTHRETKTSFVFQVQLPRGLGRVTIRPREMSDHLSSKFTTCDVNFDRSPEFSKKYYCTSDDPSRTAAKLSPEFLARIASEDKLVIQIHDDIVLLAQDKPVAEIDLVRLARVAFDVLDSLASMPLRA